MLIGYARASKADGSQPLDLQRDALRAAGIDDAANLYHDFASSVALLHKSLRHVRLSPMGQGASMRNDAESIHVPVPSTQLVRLQSGADRQGASDLLVR